MASKFYGTVHKSDHGLGEVASAESKRMTAFIRGNRGSAGHLGIHAFPRLSRRSLADQLLLHLLIGFVELLNLGGRDSSSGLRASCVPNASPARSKWWGRQRCPAIKLAQEAPTSCIAEFPQPFMRSSKA